MKKRAPRNRTLTLSDEDRIRFAENVITDIEGFDPRKLRSHTLCGDCFQIIEKLNLGSVKLLILDPPYNMNKSFNGSKFSKMSIGEYSNYLDLFFRKVKPVLAENASIYVFGEWYSSISIFDAASKYFRINNRITWEREKGRGAKANWKNACEDIWFCTVSKNYTFNVDPVRLRRKVLAPYRLRDGSPKDWDDSNTGKVRDTAPSNIWMDITVPFWSMPENTDHPTQKSEKLIAKLILASSNRGDLVLDPFLGSGTTSVVAAKLGRHFIGIDNQLEYCLLTEKRLEIAKKSQRIQGYENGIFWERNSLGAQSKSLISDNASSTVEGVGGKNEIGMIQAKLPI